MANIMSDKELFKSALKRLVTALTLQNDMGLIPPAIYESIAEVCPEMIDYIKDGLSNVVFVLTEKYTSDVGYKVHGKLDSFKKAQDKMKELFYEVMDARASDFKEGHIHNLSAVILLKSGDKISWDIDVQFEIKEGFFTKEEEEIYKDAVDALKMSGNDIDFDEWYPAWMIDENGELTENEAKKARLKVIWDKAVKDLEERKSK